MANKTSFKVEVFTISILLVFVSLIAACDNSGKYVNKKLGYEITVPIGWRRGKPLNAYSVSLYRKIKGTNKKSRISISVDKFDKWNASDFAEHMFNGLTTITAKDPLFDKYNLGNDAITSFEVINKLRMLEQNGINWINFELNIAFVSDVYTRIIKQIYYITQSDRYIFNIFLTTPLEKHIEDKKDFFSVLDSLIIKKRNSPYVIVEKAKQ